MSIIKQNSIKKRAVSSSYLKKRIIFNKKYQKFDFKKWQFDSYKKIIKKFLVYKKNQQLRILDVGSGDGIQVGHFKKIFKNPNIWCLDYSKTSLQSLKKKYKSKNINTVEIDMDNLDSFIKKKKFQNFFDIVHSSYALYYAKNQIKVLKTMKKSLATNGLYIISAPSEPHEMVNFVNKSFKIPKKIISTLKFYKNTLIPFLKKNGKNFSSSKKINYLKFTKYNDFLEFWRNTTYYEKKHENKIIKRLKNKRLLKFKKISTIASAIKK